MEKKIKHPNPCINGFYKQHAKKLCQFLFGDFFSRIDVDPHNLVFNIRVHKEIYLPIKYEIKKEILSRIVELSKEGKQVDEIKQIVETEQSSVNKAGVEDFIDIKDFKTFFGPQWKLIYESKEVA